MALYKRQYYNLSRYELDNEPSFNVYKKRFDNTNVILEDPNLVKKFHKEKLKDYGLEPSSVMEHERPRTNFWSKQKINLREFGSISNKTPFLMEGQLILPHMDPDERGTRTEPNMRKLAIDRILRGSNRPFTESNDDSIPSTTITNLGIIKRKDLSRRRFEKNFKNFESSRGNHIRSELTQAGYNPQYHRSVSENDHPYRDMYDTEQIVPKGGVSYISNNNIIGRQKSTSHRFKNSNLQQMRHVSNKLNKIYKTNHRSLLDNIFGDSNKAYNNNTFIKNVFDISNQKKQNFLEQEFNSWSSKEYRNRTKPIDYAKVAKMFWNSLKSNSNTNFSGKFDKLHLKPAFIHKMNPFSKEKVILRLPEHVLKEMAVLSTSIRKPNEVRKIRDKIIHVFDKKNSSTNIPIIINRKLPNDTTLRNKSFISLNGRSLSSYKYSTPKLKYDTLSRMKTTKSNHKQQNGYLILGENTTSRLNKNSIHARKYDTIYQDGLTYNPEDTLMNNANLGLISDPSTYMHGEISEPFSSSLDNLSKINNNTLHHSAPTYRHDKNIIIEKKSRPRLNILRKDPKLL